MAEIPKNGVVGQQELNEIVRGLEENGLTPDWEKFYETGILEGHRSDPLISSRSGLYDALDGLTPEAKEAILEVEGY